MVTWALPVYRFSLNCLLFCNTHSYTAKRLVGYLQLSIYEDFFLLFIFSIHPFCKDSEEKERKK